MRIEYSDAEKFVGWLLGEAVSAARGDRQPLLKVAPEGRFWLARIAPEEKVRRNPFGERGERLEPCEVGVRVRPTAFDGRTVKCRARMVAWKEIPHSDDPEAIKWEKTKLVDVATEVRAPSDEGDIAVGGREVIASALAGAGAQGLAAEVHAEVESGKDGLELVLTLVNVSPETVSGLDTNLYEVELEVDVGPCVPFLLDNLRESFRYDRRVPAYGVNSGVRQAEGGVFVTTAAVWADRNRPRYWDEATLGGQPELSFRRLASEPIEPLRDLVSALKKWVAREWSEGALRERSRSEGWPPDVLQYAMEEAEEARSETDRVEGGVDLLERDPLLRRAFMLANRAFLKAPAIRHEAWRPFQLGFVLANLAALHPDSQVEERRNVDTLWFATAGGKTETYLLFTLTAALYDRLTGKSDGITSWGRFPLRMLSLQQTQRFADVFAAAELIRQEEAIGGSAFSVGFLVGEAGTPNRIERDGRPGQPDPSDPDMPSKFRVLIRCPFCTSERLEMRFDQTRWALDHVCTAPGCPWGGRPLPFRIVDEEIFRWLPTVVIGTLDKAASVAVQAAMRGFYGAPNGKCAKPNHGFTYAPRSKSPTGCLYPGCSETPLPLDQDPRRYGPSVRMQDELHLLRDSLGSVDAHYEALLDDLQGHSGSTPKVIASSATLEGYERQVEALYRRHGRVFPVPGPRARRSFWSIDSQDLARRYVGVAPHGVTLEYANDQLVYTLQLAVRRALEEPRVVAAEVGVAVDALPGLVWAYGVDVVYGSTLKDVEAAARSFEAQMPLDRVNPATLTGRTPLDEVRATLARLTQPEADFYDRIHLVAASSMLSHGVDIDRLNVMVMLGLPLSTAEFIQTTARVGRVFPGLVFVLHKIGRERDAAVFRIFASFVEHMDRLIDPVPITSKSRRVLELTFSGLEQARIYGVHEPAAVAQRLKQLTVPRAVKNAFTRLRVTEPGELQALIEMLGFTGPLDENLRQDLKGYVREFFRALNDPAGSAQWVSDLFPTGKPMMSLRDVEEQIPVYSRGGGS